MDGLGGVAGVRHAQAVLPDLSAHGHAFPDSGAGRGDGSILEVGTGAESTSRAADDDDADLRLPIVNPCRRARRPRGGRRR